MQAIPKVIKYDQKFGFRDEGWGCGYAVFPKDTKINLNGETLRGFDQPITYDEIEGDNRVIGFDTRHGWCKAAINTEQWVKRKAQELADLINDK